MVNKTELARKAFQAGNIKEALRIAKTFRLGLTKEDHDAIVRGYECMVHPDFYRAIGKDPKAETERGLRVFKEKIMRSVS